MKNILFAIAMLFSFTAFAQTVTIYDKTTLHPLQHVRVVSDKGSVETNSKGIADVTVLDGSAIVTVSAIGYADFNISYADLQSLEYKIYLTETTYDLDEVVVSANKFEEKKVEVPQQIQVLQQKDLEYMNQSTTADVMTQTGNVLVQKSQQGDGSPIIRGFEANKVLMVVDGVRMNNAIYRAGHLQNIISIDNSMLEKVEVVNGPGSVVYGSDALGGVMHFYTKNPTLADSGSSRNIGAGAYTRYATAANEKTGHVDVNIASKRFGSLTSLTVSSFGDLRTGSNRNPFYGNWGKRNVYQKRINGVDVETVNSDENVQKKSGYSQIDVLQKFLFKQSRSVSHIVNFQFSKSSDIPRYDRLTDVASGKLKFGEWYYGPQERVFASYGLNLSNKNLFYDNARVIAGWQNLVESRHDRRFNNPTRNNRVEQVNLYTINADFSKQIGKNELRYGLEGNFNQVNSQAWTTNVVTGKEAPLDTRYPDGGSRMRTLAAYLTGSREISKKFIASAGIRYSNIYLNSKFNDLSVTKFPFNEVKQNSSAFNGNVGLVYLPGADWKVSALASSGFRAPNLDDMGKVFESVAGNLIVPNPDLKPEYTYNAELGVSKVFSKTIRTEVVGYYTWYKDAIITKPFKYNGQDSVNYKGQQSLVTANQNVRNAYVYGVSASLSADITRQFSIVSTVNYTYGRIKTDSVDYPLDHIPPVFGKTDFILKLKKFKSSFYVIYNGAKRSSDFNLQGEDNQVYSADPVKGFIPAWMTLNLRASYQINKVLQVQGAVENILDTYYRVFASGIGSPGRNFVLTLRANF